MRSLNQQTTTPHMHEPLFLGLASRDDARDLSRAVLEGVSPDARTLVVDLDGDGVRCVYAMGTEPVAFWDLDGAALRKDAGAAVRASRLQALRGSVGELVIVRRKAARGGAPLGALAALVSTALERELAITRARVAVAPASASR